ncbi:hypothetical protein U3A58_06260 [Algoriphagus sp. C2-6-M1]|uniref:hypothetical protein n=1 Tax=Algoriphagus persicinus TaxID=3108754 RepID=UPI002B3F365C|nr:hypothetical protein [Algoriphagus sp. C2-6-M1]MEB2779987.1 hypothetical protein [Algoriphagus sp. C2-6-M1]
MKKIKNFRATVLKNLHHGKISKDEAKECLKRGFGNIELPLFFEFEEKDPMRAYIQGLEKIGLINPLFRE